MTKKDLIVSVSNAHPNILRKNIEEAINLFFEMITFYLMHQQRVELRGFGVFSVRQRSPHKAHNPQTGEIISIPAKKVPFFKASQILKENLKSSYPQSVKTKKRGFFALFYENAIS